MTFSFNLRIRLRLLVDIFIFTAGLGEGFEMRWCTISAQETSKCEDFKLAINKVASTENLSVNFSCVQGSKAVDCMGKIKSGKADLITLDGGEIFTAGNQTLLENLPEIFSYLSIVIRGDWL